MPARYMAFITLCCFASLALRYWPTPAPVPPSLFDLLKHPGSETILALGGRLSLRHAGLYDLELIPGISDRLGQELLKNRSAILAAAKTMPPAQRYRALELTKGVGPKTALKLSEWLSLDD